MDRIECAICSEDFSDLIKPMIICQEGHSTCLSCYNSIKTGKTPLCPTCRQKLLSEPIVNRDVLALINSLYGPAAHLPVIPDEELKLEAKPFGFGGSADVFRAQWKQQTVVIKRLRTGTNDEKQLAQLKGEISIHVGLRHPCIISLYGYTSTGNGKEIVMEYAKNGSLDKNWKNADQNQLISWALDIIDGLQYLHSRKISHR